MRCRHAAPCGAASGETCRNPVCQRAVSELSSQSNCPETARRDASCVGSGRRATAPAAICVAARISRALRACWRSGRHCRRCLQRCHQQAGRASHVKRGRLPARERGEGAQRGSSGAGPRRRRCGANVGRNHSLRPADGGLEGLGRKTPLPSGRACAGGQGLEQLRCIALPLFAPPALRRPVRNLLADSRKDCRWAGTARSTAGCAGRHLAAQLTFALRRAHRRGLPAYRACGTAELRTATRAALGWSDRCAGQALRRQPTARRQCRAACGACAPFRNASNGPHCRPRCGPLRLAVAGVCTTRLLFAGAAFSRSSSGCIARLLRLWQAEPVGKTGTHRDNGAATWSFGCLGGASSGRGSLHRSCVAPLRRTAPAREGWRGRWTTLRSFPASLERPRSGCAELQRREPLECMQPGRSWTACSET